MDSPKPVSRDEWRAARKALVEELTRLREQFSRTGRASRHSSEGEQCETHHDGALPAAMGFASLNPSYGPATLRRWCESPGFSSVALSR